MERIKTLDSGAAIVDSYKAMFKQVLAERNLLAERNADLEFQISLRALPFETGASLDDPVNQRQVKLLLFLLTGIVDPSSSSQIRSIPGKGYFRMELLKPL